MRPSVSGVDLEQVRQVLELGQFADQADDGGDVARLGGAQGEERACRVMRAILQRLSRRSSELRAALAYSRCDGFDRRRLLTPRRLGADRFVAVRGLDYHVHHLGRAVARHARAPAAGA